MSATMSAGVLLLTKKGDEGTCFEVPLLTRKKGEEINPMVENKEINPMVEILKNNNVRMFTHYCLEGRGGPQHYVFCAGPTKSKP